MEGEAGTDFLKLKPINEDVATSSGRRQIEETYTYEKEAYLHRNIQRYRELIAKLEEISTSDSFLFLDDLYHIRRADQARVIDYFHRIAKNNSLWLKIGTIRHRTTWYLHGNPPVGVKLGDDADEIDLDISLEQFGLAKDFLVKVLQNFLVPFSSLDLDTLITEEGKNRLVLASGGVARDFLGVFRRSVDVAKQRVLERGEHHRGPRVGAEDVNQAAGAYDITKQEELQYDTGLDDLDEESVIEKEYNNIKIFCTRIVKANILLVDKDIPKERLELIEELVDLRLLHKIKSNVTISKRQGHKFVAYMLDLSQYTGERKIRDFEIIDFWDKGINLRQLKFIYDPATDYSTLANEAKVLLEATPQANLSDNRIRLFPDQSSDI